MGPIISKVRRFFGCTPPEQDEDREKNIQVQKVDQKISQAEFFNHQQYRATTINIKQKKESSTPFDNQNFAQIKQINIKLEYLQGIKTKQSQNFEEMAYLFAELAQLKAKQEGNQYEIPLRSAINIFNSFNSKFIQEQATLLSNVALFLSDNKTHSVQQIAKLYIQALQICENYYPINDLRTLIMKNNLALYYLENNRIKQASKIQSEFASIKQNDRNRQILNNFQQNMKKYRQ